MNIMVLPSSGEGFGVPVLEGNACGIPTIMTNSTSAQQLVGQGQGYLADVDSTYIFRGFRRAMVSAKSIAKWLEFTYNNPNALLQTSATAVADAQKYDFKLIQSQWVDLLSK
jgi:glycosyltransferase involved in cell wall biosynthesis